MDIHRIRQILHTEHTLQPDEWKGAVLFLFNHEHVFFIKRSEAMPTHSGQIAFIGGLKKDSELNPWMVIDREFEEESGFKSQVLNFLGYLPVVRTARLWPIIPVMAELLISTDQFIREIKTNGEWDECLAYSWRELKVETNWEYSWRCGSEKFPILFHPIRKGTYIPKNHHFQTHLLWGATAYIVWDFLHLYYGQLESYTHHT